eukprot:Rmarinus@m.20413
MMRGFLTDEPKRGSKKKSLNLYEDVPSLSDDKRDRKPTGVPGKLPKKEDLPELDTESLPVMSTEELSRCNGVDGTPLRVGLQGLVYDVSKGKNFYGKGGAYHVFAGRHATRAFALMSTKVEDAVPSIDGLKPIDLKTLEDWVVKFRSKYPVVAKIVS